MVTLNSFEVLIETRYKEWEGKHYLKFVWVNLYEAASPMVYISLSYSKKRHLDFCVKHNEEIVLIKNNKHILIFL